MAHKSNRIIKYLCVTAVCVLVVFFIVFVIATVYVIGDEHLLVKERIDNVFVNGDFVGWKTVVIDSEINFKIPEEWDLVKHGNVYYLHDKRDRFIAYGAEVVGEKADYRNFDLFLEKIFKIDVQVLTTTVEQQIHSSTFGFVKVNGSSENTYLYIALRDATIRPDFYICFSPDNGIIEDDLYTIAEAIIFSFCFPY